MTSPFWLLLLGALAVSGCASKRAVLPDSRGHIVVLELAPAPSPRSLGRVLHNKHPDRAFLTGARKRINEELDADLRAALLPGVETSKRIDIEPLEQLEMTPGRPLAGAALTELQSSYPADTYLRIRVTDYGETPRRWEAAYIGFEVVSTAAIAGALYVHEVTRPVAAAYLGEETVEEVSEGYAGFWALNRLSRPVRIEADMVDARSVDAQSSESAGRRPGTARARASADSHATNRLGLQLEDVVAEDHHVRELARGDRAFLLG